MEVDTAMPSLTGVIHRHCARRDCQRFGMSVETGTSCSVCLSPLVARRQIKAWVLTAVGAVALLLALLVGFLVFHSHEVSPAATTGTSIEAATRNLSRGHDLIQQGHYQEARLAFLSATEEDPDNATAWADLGGANSVLGRIEEARAAYERALGLEPDNWLAHYNLAVLLAHEGDRNGAVRHLKAALSLTRNREQKRREIVADLRRSPSLRTLLTDPRIRPLVGP